MKQMLFILIYLAGTKLLTGQQIANQRPYVNTDFKKYLYVAFDNPIYISTGKYDSLKIETSNGTITQTKEQGKYILNPTRCETTIVTLSCKEYRQQFLFECAIMSYPEITLSGLPREHGILPVRQSTGISARHIPLDLDIEYRIDSFRIIIRDSIGEQTHINYGPRWDSTATGIIQRAKKGSRLIIDKAMLTGPGSQRFTGKYFEMIIGE